MRFLFFLAMIFSIPAHAIENDWKQICYTDADSCIYIGTRVFGNEGPKRTIYWVRLFSDDHLTSLNFLCSNISGFA